MCHATHTTPAPQGLASKKIAAGAFFCFSLDVRDHTCYSVCEMKHDMRKSERQLGREEAEDILLHGEYGVLSTCGADGEPYGTPISYVYADGAICFHCAPGVGHKLANIAENPQVCFTVVGHTQPLPAKFSTIYRSAVAFGIAEALEGDAKRDALRRLIAKYSPDFTAEGEAYIARAFDRVGVYAIRISRLTAKGRLA